MNWAAKLEQAGKRHQRARTRLAETEAERARLIRAAHTQGGLTVREIATRVGVSPTRVGQIIKPRP